jgi:hypothetical protein
MTDLKRRVATLERAAGADGAVCECPPTAPAHGTGPRVVWVLAAGEQCDDPETVCRACGRVRPVLRVVWTLSSEKGGHGEPEEE